MSDARFQQVMDAMTHEPGVTLGRGFNCPALMVNGRIFVAMSWKGEFIAKLPASRVEEMTEQGQGEPWDPSMGRRLREWVAITTGPMDWVRLAREAYAFVKGEDKA